MDDDFIIRKLKEERKDHRLEDILNKPTDDNKSSEFLEKADELTEQIDQLNDEFLKKYFERQINQLKELYRDEIGKQITPITNTSKTQTSIDTTNTDIYEAENIAEGRVRELNLRCNYQPTNTFSDWLFKSRCRKSLVIYINESRERDNHFYVEIGAECPSAKEILSPMIYEVKIDFKGNVDNISSKKSSDFIHY